MAALVGLLCVGLTRWWAPFGWWAWGSRLVLLAVASVPHLISIYRSNELLNALFVEPGECPGPDLPKRYAQSWRCLRAQACSHPSPLLHAYRMAPGTDMPKRALFYPALLALGCLGLRRARLSRTCSPWAPRRCRCP
ncbi:MAG TPA: hypothetical protein VE057_15140 [Archangium sp.]|nr:hypothetical protein [Archangium sp.]